MALSKTLTMTRQLQNNTPPEVSATFVTVPIVQDGVLVPDYRTANPGVFTAGTPREGTSPNSVNQSNS